MELRRDVQEKAEKLFQELSAEYGGCKTTIDAVCKQVLAISDLEWRLWPVQREQDRKGVS